MSLRSLTATFTQTLFTAVLLALSLSSTYAQTTTKSNTDGMTPPGMAPGAPAGAYPLSGIENVNLFNRHLNFTMPLLKVGGRGNTSVTIPLRIERKWRVNHAVVPCNQNCPPGQTVNHYYYPIPNWWSGIEPGYGPGVLTGRWAGQGSTVVASCGTGSITKWSQSITRLTFTAGDGTEYELRDETFNGQPKPAVPNCSTNNINRGTVFKTADGSSVTFNTTLPVYDKEIPPTQASMFYPSGDMWMKDGTRYHIEQGLVTWICDRNGNKINFTYDGSLRVSVITDSLNRQITFTYGDHNAYQSDFITFYGNGGAPRSIEVGYTGLNLALRPGFSIQTYAALFPSLNGGGTTYQPPVISYVKLPDNRQYSFKYNSYGELARVVLPTGGATEYDWSGPATDNVVSGTSNDGSGYTEREIIRFVTERRTYPNGGTGATQESRTTYTGNIALGGTGAPTLVRAFLNNATVPSSIEAHAFQNTVIGDLFQSGVYYPAGLTGKELQVEMYNSEADLAAVPPVPLRRTTTTWGFRQPVSWTGATSGQPGNDPRIGEEITALLDGGSNLVSKVSYTYDSAVPFNQVTNKSEYDYGAGAPGNLIRQTLTTYNNTGYIYTPLHIRSLPILVQVRDGAGAVKSQVAYEYDYYLNDGLHNYVGDCPGATGFDTSYNTSYVTRGNVTCVTGYADAASGGSPSRKYYQYDILGNVAKTMDAGRTDGTRTTTSFAYNDNFGVANGVVQFGGNPDNTPPTEVPFGQNTYAFVTKIVAASGTTVSQTAYTQYDYYTGKPVDFEDPNGIKSTYLYEDPLDRFTKGIKAFGTVNSKALTSITYDDTNRKITSVSDQNNYYESATGTGIKACAFYDGLGRTYRQASYEGSTWAITDTQFDGMGRVEKVSNPYRDANPATPSATPSAWTTTAYDMLSRATTVTTPDGAIVTTQYQGNRVKVIDQANAQRISESDGLGRLCKVWEVMSGGPDSLTFNGTNHNGYCTTYAYDTLDNLTTVTQGVQTRTFAYDSLKRLTSAANPESGTTTYVYDPNGNLCEKTDARTTKTTFVYDALNRPTQKTYTGTTTEGLNAASATQSVYYKYDNQALPTGAPTGFNRGFAVGRLVAVTYGSGAAGNYYGYDELGRVLRRTQKFDGNTNDYAVTATYNRAGAMTGEAYPSGDTVSYGYDMAGRLTNFSGKLGTNNMTSTTYATVTQFSAASQIERETYGMATPLYLKQVYNNRLQLVDTRLGTVNDATNWDRGRLSLVYGTTTFNLANTRDNANVEMTVTDLQGNNTDNNGNVKRMYHFLPDGKIPQRDDYTYDPLNRLTAMTECQRQTAGGAMVANVANQNYTYDRYGNNTITGLNPSGLSFNAANNRITTANYAYDSVGNLTSQNNQARTYDAENRMVSAASNGFYTYDGEGKRIKRTANGTTTCYVYGIGGELLVEYVSTALAPGSPSKQYGYKGGKLLVTAEGSTLKWLVADHLGSTRMELNSSGAVDKRHDYLPFGEELLVGTVRSATNAYEPPVSTTRQRFGTYERDNETGLDFAQARYYTNVQGRFSSPDNPFADHERLDPQSWNLYSYVRNRPLAHTDRSGRACYPGNSSSLYCKRAEEYRKYDADPAINQKTRFFAAAGAVSELLASGDPQIKGVGWSGYVIGPIAKVGRIIVGGISGTTHSALSTIGLELQKLNATAVQSIREGKLGGPNLDGQLVHMEQTKVQSILDNLKKNEPDKYKTVIGEINGLLNPSGLITGPASKAYSTDAAFVENILDPVRKELGRDIDFANQSDRELLGNRLVEYIRKNSDCRLGRACN